MLRADMDALPVREASGVDYASAVTATDAAGHAVPVAHACGHDMHVAWLAGVTSLFAQRREAWRGTLMAVFQPGEETAQGARAMASGSSRGYSITSSARAKIVCGIETPSEFAVLRLITSSYLVGSITGKSGGRAPLKIFPA